ncbi:curlin repeat-containing protein [Pelagibacterium montanilacus]|uniref:curlin repeat-containing protein n=1 Tax=Pelagibacterium montanilacus TaxID=2185280 RepID=UPI001FE9B038|nr:curlin repeat-containing protein [Pelagibacterium montanilacus]
MTAISKRFTKSFAAGVAAATIAMVSMIAPAQAGGQISLNYNPSNARDAQMVQMGLGIYQIVNEIERNGGIRQRGNNNTAGVAQNGGGNFGVVHQEGRGHNGTVQQNGNSNSYGLFQFGRNTNAHVNQNGNGQSGLGLVFGW